MQHLTDRTLVKTSLLPTGIVAINSSTSLVSFIVRTSWMWRSEANKGTPVSLMHMGWIKMGVGGGEGGGGCQLTATRDL